MNPESTITPPPRIGDTFFARCPSCSPDKPVLHVVRGSDQRKGKYHLDILCVSAANCFRQIIGSFDETDAIFHVTWLDQTPDGKTRFVRTEVVPNVLHSQEWASKLAPRREMSEAERASLASEVVTLLSHHEYHRKRNLEEVLAKLRPEFSALNLSFLNQLRLSFPEFSMFMKSLRLSGKVRFGLHYGHHVFGRGRPVEKSTNDEPTEEAHQRLRQHRVAAGPIRVTVVFYLPVADESHLDHFFQAVFPWAELRTPFHRLTLSCKHGDRKRSQANFRIDDAEFTMTLKPHRLEITAKLEERFLEMSLMKVIIMGSVIAREVTCTARQEHQLLMHRGQPHIPSIVLVHNQLAHSDALWKSEFTNLHRSFHAFPQMDGAKKRSVSQRLVMSHTHHAVEFDDAEVLAHLQQFQLLFLREFIGALGSDDVYVPPSVLRAYAPKGIEIESLVADLTELYEERLKKTALEREKVERSREQVLNQHNFWLSVLFLLFAIAQATDNQWVNWLVAGLAGVFVGFLAWRSLSGGGRKPRG